MDDTVGDGRRAGQATVDGGARVPAAPSAVAGGFATALLAGDATSAASHFSTIGHCLTPDGTAIFGRPAIAALLAQLTASDHRLEIHAGRTIVADSVAALLAQIDTIDRRLERHARHLTVAEELALCTQYWTRSSAPASPERFRVRTTARFLLVREERTWQIAIASPWG